MDVCGQVVELLNKNPRGLCITDIAGGIDVHRITAMAALAELKGADMVEYQKVGPTKFYFLKNSRVILDVK